jgi:N-carbamoyl-L-amino-acid hydrolase
MDLNVKSLLLAGLTALHVAAPCSAFAQSDLEVDGGRLNGTMTTMKTFGGTPEGGSTRVAYSDSNKAAF